EFVDGAPAVVAGDRVIASVRREYPPKCAVFGANPWNRNPIVALRPGIPASERVVQTFPRNPAQSPLHTLWIEQFLRCLIQWNLMSFIPWTNWHVSPQRWRDTSSMAMHAFVGNCNLTHHVI